MSESGKDALLLAQAQELERQGLRLQALEAATYNATPFAHFEAEKEILTICIPKCPEYLAIRSDPFHVFRISPQRFCFETYKFNLPLPLAETTFSCQINGNQSCKTWHVCTPDWATFFKRDPSSTSRFVFRFAGKNHELPFYAIWTKDVEERFCAELDKAWRAFGAEI